MSKKERVSSVALYWRLLSYVKYFWFAFLIAIIANGLFSAVDASFTYLLKPVLNKGFIARDIHFISFIPFIILGAFIFRGIASFASSYFMAVVSRGVVMRFRQSIFNHLLKLPAAYYDSAGSGNILSTIIYNVDQIANASANAVTDAVQSFCLIVGLLIVMFMMSWKLSLIYLVTMPMVAIAVRFSSKRMRRISLAIQEKMGEVTSIAKEGIEGYKVIRSFGGQTHEKERFDNATNRNRGRELKVVVTKSLSVSGVQIIAATAISIIVYLATLHQMALSAGSFTSMIAAMLAILKPLKTLTSVNATIQKGLAGAQSVFKLLDQPAEDDSGTFHIDRVNGKVVFDHVSFSYPTAKNQALNSVSFSIAPGQTVALVGRSGGGKSTLINLLQRFYDNYEGQILIDDVSIRDYVLTDLRKQFAFVSQHITLFNDTIAHNIAYGKFDDVTESEIIDAAKKANAWGFIKELPDRLDTLVGDNGFLLSGGQRQRIAIARAIIKDAPILILDEATAALDTESEHEIQKALTILMEGRTSMVIAHRLSTIEKADLILVIDGGRIVEHGDHQSLMSLNGYYARLNRMQFRDEV